MDKLHRDRIAEAIIFFLIITAFICFALLAYLGYKNTQNSYGKTAFSMGVVSYTVAKPLESPKPATDKVPAPTVKAPEVQANYDMKVLAVNYNPIENGVNTAEKYFSFEMGYRSARELEKYAYNQVIQSFKKLSSNRINYSIVKQIDITEFPVYPDGFKFSVDSYSQCVGGHEGFNAESCEQRKIQFDYEKWAKDYKICELASANNVDEIWVMGLPYVMAYESFMIGPNDGFWVNGPSFSVDTCKKHYIVINPVYNAPDNFMHDIGHRVESTMVYTSSVWTKEDIKKYWSVFSRWDDQKNQTAGTCGNTHFPTNATADYEFSKKELISSSCIDWKNFPNLKGLRQSINCDDWGCTDTGWQTYWLGSLPSSAGDATMISNNGKEFKFKRDWWYYLLYPENAIRFIKEED